MLTWPDSLVEDIARRRAVIVLGSGISRNSTNSSGRSPKTWGEFLTGGMTKMTGHPEYKAALDRYDYLTACELLKRKIGLDPFRTLLLEEFLSPKYVKSEYHEVIFRLDSRIVATPNFDKIYETHANTEAHGSVMVKYHYEDDVADAIRRDGRVILKIHGTIDASNRMIFTRGEYAEARTKYQSFYKLLEALALTHTFLFLGCGLNDPDTRLILEDIFFRYEVSRPHFFVLPEGTLTSFEKDVSGESMDVSFLEYPLKAGKDHSELLNSLKELEQKVDVARNNIITTRNW
jgi:hypothetical protein